MLTSKKKNMRFANNKKLGLTLLNFKNKCQKLKI